MKYRPEIDGLRAIAVIIVMLYHAKFDRFQGGYVGVDVFFVISGYLITSIILTEMAAGKFTLVGFYERRARRILPALFLVMLVCLPLAWFWLLPEDMRNFSQSLVAVSVFASNFLFLREQGYWDAASDLKPLLHMWSLAVEEQYYLFFPLFMLLLWRFRRRWLLGSFVVVAVVSLGLAQWGAFAYPKLTFFTLPARAWELAIGAMLAYLWLYRQATVNALTANRAVNEVLGITGLLAIGYAVYAYHDQTPYPSLYTLVPTVGTGMLLLFATPQTLAGRVLSTKLLVGIGLISYSAYLWHQPLFAFARHASQFPPAEPLLWGLLLLAFALAYLSWRFVETPFRNRQVVSRRVVFGLALVGSVFYVAVGVGGHLTRGFAWRTAPNGVPLLAIEQKLRANFGLNSGCDKVAALPAACQTSADPEILVWGDSFAMHIVPSIVASNPAVKLVQITKSVCGPFFDLAPILPDLGFTAEWAAGCLAHSQQVRTWLQSNATVKYVVVSSPFDAYLTTEYFLLPRNGEVIPVDQELVAAEFGKTLREIAAMGKIPVIISPTATPGTSLGHCLARSEILGRNLDECNYPVTAFSASVRARFSFLEQFQNEYPILRLDRLTCDDAMCTTHLGATYLFRDKGHLSVEGSSALGKLHDFYGWIVASDHVSGAPAAYH